MINTKLKRIVTILIIFTMIIGLIVANIYIRDIPTFLTIPFLHTRMYKGDRYTCNISITVNDEQYFVDKISCEFEGSTINLKNIRNRFHIKGGDYGLYDITFKIDTNKIYNQTKDEFFNNLNKDINYYIKYHSTNWWNITTIDIDIRILEDNNGWYSEMVITYTEQPEIGGSITEVVGNKVYLNDETEIKVLFGV